MDGLLIAEQLALLTPRLPASRGAWRFPDDRTAVLPLHDGAVVTLSMRPPDPSLTVNVDGRDGVRARDTGGRGAGRPRTPFQAQLAARAAGDLVAAMQHALDRVVSLRFGEGTGFVPEPAIELVVELTGRNANLILVNADGRIVGAQRVVPGELNRHREIRGGVQYVPPPPYEKVDPRGADEEVLRSVLADRPLRDVRRTVDGIGARLYASLAALSAVEDDTAPLKGTDLDRAVASLMAMVAGPTASLHEAGELDADVGRAERRTEALRSAVAKRLAKRTQVASKRVADARLAVAAAADVAAIRAEADLLLASVGSYDPHGDTVELVGFDGTPVRLAVDPKLDAAANAAQRYARARRREGRAARAQERLPDLLKSLRDLEEASAELASADLERLEAIERMLDELVPGSDERPGHPGGKPKPRLPGVRFVDPRGYEVLVGRSARENDAITFGVAKSRDLWLHVQGYQGSHVIVRSQGREVPFDTVLFAARLAAGYSRAKGSDNVPVDYTERKNVWRVKGGAPGAVHLAHQKTVYVTPARDDTGATGGGGSTRGGGGDAAGEGGSTSGGGSTEDGGTTSETSR